MKKQILLIVLFFAWVIKNVNAQTWSPVGSGMSNAVVSFVVYNNELYAGGLFTTAGGTTAYHIAKWNGISWAAVGGGIAEGGGSVVALTVYNNELYAGGNFTMAGGTSANFIAKWNGSSWSNVGGGMNGGVWALVVYNNELYAGGDFTTAGSISVHNIAKWNGSSWSDVGGGTDGGIDALAVYNNELYAGGWIFHTAGGVNAQNFAKWNGSSWSSVGAFDDGIFSLAVYNNELYVGGWFTSMGNGIVKWNGSSWSDVGGGMNISNGGFAGVFAFSVYENELYAGGEFFSAGTISANNIAKWNGTSWSTVGSGINSAPYGVNDLCVFNGQLYAGGYFTIAGGIPANYIAKWSNCNAPPQPGTISGNTSICSSCTDCTQIYSVSPVSGATGYTWTLPSGWTGTSTTNSITVTPGANSGNISVAAYNSCSSSTAQSLYVTVNAAPLLTSTISGKNTVCLGSSQTYSISAVTGATSYTWTLPPGWTGGSTTNSITTTIGANSGIISVIANNTCGTSNGQSLAITVSSAPAQPGNITGNDIVNVGQTFNYSINPVSNVTGYNWSISGGGNIISGQNTTSIPINWLTTGNHTLSVNATNKCGISSDQTLNVIVSIAIDPNNPFQIKIAPNPSPTDVYLMAKGVANKIILIEIFNISGQIVYNSQQRARTDDYSQLLSLGKVAAGFYLIKIFIDNKKYVRKIVRIN